MSMARVPIALQLYSVRHDCEKDFPGVLKAVAEMGYEGVEFAGFHGFGAEELKKILDDLGLKAAGAHVPLDELLGESFAKTVEFHQTLGNRYLIVPWMPEERRPDRGGWLEAARLFNELNEKARPHGMRVGYHNHTFEFEPMDGELPWDTFFSNTDADVVMQLDTGNAMAGGADPLVFLERYPGRAATVHLKEHAAANDKALIGEGDAPWNEVFRLCESVGGTEWYIVEQETYPVEPLESVKRCLENLKAMGK